MNYFFFGYLEWYDEVAGSLDPRNVAVDGDVDLQHRLKADRPVSNVRKVSQSKSHSSRFLNFQSHFLSLFTIMANCIFTFFQLGKKCTSVWIQTFDIFHLIFIHQYQYLPIKVKRKIGPDSFANIANFIPKWMIEYE